MKKPKYRKNLKYIGSYGPRYGIEQKHFGFLWLSVSECTFTKEQADDYLKELNGE